MIKTLIIGCNEVSKRVYEELIQTGDFELLAMVTHNTEKARGFIKGYPVVHFENEQRIWTRSGAHVAIFCGKLEDDLMVEGGICTQWLNMVDCCEYITSTEAHIIQMREKLMLSARRTRHTIISSVIWKEGTFSPLRQLAENLRVVLKVEECDCATLTARALIAYARACVALNNQGIFGLVHSEGVAPEHLAYRSGDYEHK